MKQRGYIRDVTSIGLVVRLVEESSHLDGNPPDPCTMLKIYAFPS
jgi:hypothetical protein